MATTVATLPPNQSIYIQNLPEKLQKEDLRRELYILFSTYGPVLDVTALKTRKMRGQAHVLFRETHSATQAMRACQGFDVCGKEMRISYSHNRSNTLAKLTGTFNQPTEKPNAQAQALTAPSTFAAIPGAPPAPDTAATTATNGATAKAGSEQTVEKQVPQKAVEGAVAVTAGMKRPREGEEEESEDEDAEDVEMEVEDEEMEMSEGED